MNQHSQYLDVKNAEMMDFHLQIESSLVEMKPVLVQIFLLVVMRHDHYKLKMQLQMEKMFAEMEEVEDFLFGGWNGTYQLLKTSRDMN